MAAQPSTEQQPPPPPEPLKYQRWGLKVPIHCEGCKRKVKKVLHSIEGVYTIAIEPKQHKVTVTGDVTADTLVKKLIKEGKHAELWPEEENKQGEGKKKKKKKKNKKKKENEPKSSEEDGASESTEKEDDEEEETEQINSVKISEGGAVTLKLNGGKPESKNTVKVTEISQNGNQSSFRVDMKGSGGDVSAENKASSGSKSSKKKKKKGHKGNPPPNEVDVSVGPPPGITGYIPIPGQVNLNPPMQQFYPYPAYEPPSYGPPMYAASYNTLYPTAHHAGLYQMGPPPPYANAYMFTDELYTPSQPLDLIDDAYAEEDEEGSGCSIM